MILRRGSDTLVGSTAHDFGCCADSNDLAEIARILEELGNRVPQEMGPMSETYVLHEVVCHLVDQIRANVRLSFYLSIIVAQLAC